MKFANFVLSITSFLLVSNGNAAEPLPAGLVCSDVPQIISSSCKEKFHSLNSSLACKYIPERNNAQGTPYFIHLLSQSLTLGKADDPRGDDESLYLDVRDSTEKSLRDCLHETFKSVDDTSITTDEKALVKKRIRAIFELLNGNSDQRKRLNLSQPKKDSDSNIVSSQSSSAK